MSVSIAIVTTGTSVAGIAEVLVSADMVVPVAKPRSIRAGGRIGGSNQGSSMACMLLPLSSKVAKVSS